MSLEWFSCVYGRTILSGTTDYISKKNYRSNVEFQNFKKTNLTEKKLLVVLLNRDVENVSQSFHDLPSLFMSQNFDYDADIIALAFYSKSFKVKKGKTFYVKSSHVLYKENTEKHMLLDNLTLECACNFQN